MEDNDKVLSQNEIDAMLAGGPTEPAAAEPAPAPEAPPPVTQAVQTAPASPPPGQAAPGVSIGGEGVEQLQQQVQQLTAQLQELNGQVDGILSGLQATVGFNAQGSFTCKSCTAHGLVAARMTCTSCGVEDWWGWFPPQQ